LLDKLGLIHAVLDSLGAFLEHPGDWLVGKECEKEKKKAKAQELPQQAVPVDAELSSGIATAEKDRERDDCNREANTLPHFETPFA
jgi:hypothetical protein